MPCLCTLHLSVSLHLYVVAPLGNLVIRWQKMDLVYALQLDADLPVQRLLQAHNC